MATLRDDVRELVRAFQRYCQRGAWDGDQENLDAAQALYALMAEAEPPPQAARGLLKTIDALPDIGELTHRLQLAAHAWYLERFPRKR